MSADPIRAQPDLCRGCEACALGCALYHEGACGLELARLRIVKDMAQYTFRITLCLHCDEPACMSACPSGALTRRESGVVFLEDEPCTRCGACASACPHDAIVYAAREDRYLKCDLCAGRQEGPLCVNLCPVGALQTATKPGTRA